MANGSKRQKVKKVFSPLQPNEPDGPAVDDDGLMDDLFAVLDNRDADEQKEAAKVIQEVNARENTTDPQDGHSALKSNARGGKSSKDKFRERLVCARHLFCGAPRLYSTAGNATGKESTSLVGWPA